MKWIKKCKETLESTKNLTYSTTCPGNNKQDVSLTFTIIDETTTVAIKSYYPTKQNVTNFWIYFIRFLLSTI